MIFERFAKACASSGSASHRQLSKISTPAREETYIEARFLEAVGTSEITAAHVATEESLMAVSFAEICADALWPATDEIAEMCLDDVASTCSVGLLPGAVMVAYCRAEHRGRTSNSIV
mmetsp:Transcript_23568/g.56780  ORF Transcript_23568/g.56780 Transcript_23568/m.56780 type:complete len:118 (+) Transcript_23568:249-602(+)